MALAKANWITSTDILKNQRYYLQHCDGRMATVGICPIVFEISPVWTHQTIDVYFDKDIVTPRILVQPSFWYQLLISWTEGNDKWLSINTHQIDKSFVVRCSGSQRQQKVGTAMLTYKTEFHAVLGQLRSLSIVGQGHCVHKSLNIELRILFFPKLVDWRVYHHQLQVHHSRRCWSVKLNSWLYETLHLCWLNDWYDFASSSAFKRHELDVPGSPCYWFGAILVMLTFDFPTKMWYCEPSSHSSFTQLSITTFIMTLVVPMSLQEPVSDCYWVWPARHWHAWPCAPCFQAGTEW